MKSNLQYETLEFNNLGNGKIRAILLKFFYFDFEVKELGSFDFCIENGAISADINQSKLENKFAKVLTKGISNLTSSLSGKPAIYLHKNSGIPLIGHNAFGIIDRNSSIIELKPITGCNLNCIYCSVDEGKNSKKVADFIIEKDYMVEKTEKLVKFKAIDNIEINIGPNGEPLLYADIIPLIKDLKKIKCIERISLNTNGVMLTKSLINELAIAGLTQLNISINSLDAVNAEKIAGGKYNSEHVQKMAEYAVKKLDVVIAPVWVPEYNDKNIPNIIKFGKEIGVKYVAIQNFLNYKFGRNPVKQKPMDTFYKELKNFETKYQTNLILDKSSFNVRDTKKLPVPFKKNEVIKVKLVSLGKLNSEKLAIGRERIVSVITDKKIGQTLKAKIIRVKHNIIVAKEV